MLSHRNIISVLSSMASRIDSLDYQQDIILGVAPMYHIMGAVVITLVSWVKGVPVVVLPRFEPESFIRAISRFRVTVRASRCPVSVPHGRVLEAMICG